MKDFPPVPTVDDAPDRLLDSGHLWILEDVDGAPLRFQLRESGLIRFGDRSRVWDDPDEIPLHYRHAVRHVRANLDREALRGAVDDVTDVVCLGVATVRRGIDYDWERTPAFLGVDVWSADAGAVRPPDAARGIFERLGLRPIDAVERELPARDFDPDSYAFPTSARYDGPAAGVLVRNKRGDRALLSNPAVETVVAPERDGDGEAGEDAAELAGRFATGDRFERIASDLQAHGTPVTAERLAERTLEAAAREFGPSMIGGSGTLDASPLRSELGTRARAFLEDRPDDAW